MKGFAPRRQQRLVAVFLEALGFTLAAGKNYCHDRIKSLIAKYLNIYTQFSLAKEEELKPVMDYQNQLDYIVAVESGVFVHSYDGNMANAVTGH